MNAISFTRKGTIAEAENAVETWICDIDAHSVATLFEQLEAVHLTSVTRIEPESPLDGGETKNYTMTYGGQKTFSLRYGSGMIYANGELIVMPIEAFIEDVRRMKHTTSPR